MLATTEVIIKKSAIPAQNVRFNRSIADALEAMDDEFDLLLGSNGLPVFDDGQNFYPKAIQKKRRAPRKRLDPISDRGSVFRVRNRKRWAALRQMMAEAA